MDSAIDKQTRNALNSSAFERNLPCLSHQSSFPGAVAGIPMIIAGAAAVGGSAMGGIT